MVSGSERARLPSRAGRVVWAASGARTTCPLPSRTSSTTPAGGEVPRQRAFRPDDRRTCPLSDSSERPQGFGLCWKARRSRRLRYSRYLSPMSSLGFWPWNRVGQKLQAAYSENRKQSKRNPNEVHDRRVLLLAGAFRNLECQRRRKSGPKWRARMGQAPKTAWRWMVPL